MKSRGIIFINQSAGYLLVDIINAFSSKYEKRTLLAGSLVFRATSFNGEVDVVKISEYDRSSSVKRLYSWFKAFIQSLVYLTLKDRKSDLFIVSNPPLNILLPIFTGRKVSFLVYDVYPDVLVSSGVIKENSIVHRMFERINRRAFKKVDTIFTISEGMKKVLTKYAEENKIKVIPIWSDNEFLKPIKDQDNTFIKQHSLENKFVVMYSGNLGRTHEVELMLELARRCMLPDIFFLIIGAGEKYDKIKSSIASLNLQKNVKLLPLQPVEMLPYSLNAAKIAFISLGASASKLSVPSKTFSFLSVGSPLICVCDKDAELNNIVSEYNTGRCFESNQIDDMLTFIELLYTNHGVYRQMSNNCLVASTHFTRENALNFTDV